MWSDLGKFIGGALAGLIGALLSPIRAYFHDRSLVKQGVQTQQKADDDASLKAATDHAEMVATVSHASDDALSAGLLADSRPEKP